MRFFITIIILATFSKPHAQTLGGNTAYNFLRLPAAPAISAAGGLTITPYTTDVSLALNNPALLNASLHAHASLNFTQLIAGVKGYQATGAYYYQKWQTTFGAQVFFIDYGNIQATDAAGNSLGRFRATDYAIQLSAGRQYLQKWHYGGSVKFIQSSYQPYRSSAIAVDAGIHYFDSAKNLSVAVLAKNMGSQLRQYVGISEELPFDLQVGITKRLAKAPLAFSATIQQAHRFNLLYDDTTFSAETGLRASGTVADKVLQHFVFATHLFISKQLELTVGYNHLRRADLNTGTSGNGLAGFSAGFAARFEKLHISYARSTYQRGIAYNQFGLNLMLATFFGAGLL